MKKLLLLLFISQHTLAQNFQKYYDRDFGTANSIGELGHSIQQTTDGGYIAVGISDNFGIGQKDIYVVRLNSNGDTLWTKLYGNAAGNDMARSIIQTADGGFAISAETQSGAGGIDAAVLKIDVSGNLLWSKAFGGSGKELGHDIIEMSDGSLILAGQALSYSANGYDEIFLVKIDQNGTFLWAKTLNGGGGEIARHISKTSDGGFIISGDESSFNYGLYMAKFNANADTAWCRTYRAAFSSYEGFGVSQTADGGYIMTGYTYGGSIGGTDMIALKVNSTGAITWVKEIGTPNYDYAMDIIQTTDGGYVLSGTATPGGSYSEMVLAKLNSSGALQWSKNYSGQYGTTYAMDARFQVIQTSDNGLAAIGSIYNNFGNSLSEIYNGFDMLIVKTNSTGDGFNAGCIKNANLQTANVTWNEYSAPFTITAITPTVTNSPFTQKFTAGNYGNAAVKINFAVSPVSCGLCDGSATANTCDSLGSYCSGANPYTYLWSDAMSQTAETATGLCAGSYLVTITDYVGCMGIGTAFVSSGALPQEICLVTVDSTSTKNVIVWEKPVSASIDSFIVYREIGLNNYIKIGSVAYADLSKFTDETQGINPNTTSYRYKISTLDNCGNESPKSAEHKTIHLQVSPASPSGINLNWTDYLGFSFSQYRIFRDIDDSGFWQIIDSVSFSITAYTDVSGTQNSRYIVEAAHPLGLGCTATKAAENHNSSRSNKTYPLAPPGPESANELSEDFSVIRIIPNPGNGIFEIHSLRLLSSASISVYNLLGEEVFKADVGNKQSAVIDLSLHPAGIYYCILKSPNTAITKKFVLSE